MCTKSPNTRLEKISINNNVRWYVKSAKSNNSRRLVGAFSRYLLYQVLCANTTQLMTPRSSRSMGGGEGEREKGKGVPVQNNEASVLRDTHRIF